MARTNILAAEVRKANLKSTSKRTRHNVSFVQIPSTLERVLAKVTLSEQDAQVKGSGNLNCPTKTRKNQNKASAKVYYYTQDP